MDEEKKTCQCGEVIHDGEDLCVACEVWSDWYDDE
jgi:hypothetical protein